MIFRTCSGGKSYKKRHQHRVKLRRSALKEHIHTPVFPYPRNLLCASRRNAFSASVSTSEIFESRLQAGVVNRTASLNEAFPVGAVASRGEAAPCQWVEE